MWQMTLRLSIVTTAAALAAGLAALFLPRRRAR